MNCISFSSVEPLPFACKIKAFESLCKYIGCCNAIKVASKSLFEPNIVYTRLPPLDKSDTKDVGTRIQMADLVKLYLAYKKHMIKSGYTLFQLVETFKLIMKDSILYFLNQAVGSISSQEYLSVPPSLRIDYVDSKMHKFYNADYIICLLYTSPSPRDLSTSRMPSSA